MVPPADTIPKFQDVPSGCMSITMRRTVTYCRRFSKVLDVTLIATYYQIRM